MKRFKSTRRLQRFLSIHDPVANLFHFPQHALASSDHWNTLDTAMATWSQISRITAT